MNSFEEQENLPEPSEATRAVRRLIRGLSATVHPQPAVTTEQPHKCQSDADAAAMPVPQMPGSLSACRVRLWLLANWVWVIFIFVVSSEIEKVVVITMQPRQGNVWSTQNTQNRF